MLQTNIPAANISAHLNKTRSIHSSCSNSVVTRKGLTSPLDQRGNRQTVGKARCEREAGLEMIRPSNIGDGGDRDRHWHILTREVDNRISSRGDCSGHGELERHILRLGRRDDGQWAERGQVDAGQRLRTRARNDEHLDRSKRKAGRSTC